MKSIVSSMISTFLIVVTVIISIFFNFKINGNSKYHYIHTYGLFIFYITNSEIMIFINSVWK